MDAIAQVSTRNYGFPKAVGPVSLGSFKNKLISLQWSLGTRGTEQSSQQRCFFNQLELLAIVQDSTQSSPHCWATTLTSQWEILFEQGLHDLTQLKSFFGIWCLLQIGSSISHILCLAFEGVLPLATQASWLIAFFGLFSHSCLGAPGQYSISEECPALPVTKMQTWAPQQDCLFLLLH